MVVCGRFLNNHHFGQSVMPKPGFDLESRLTKGQNPVPITVLRRLFILLIAAWLPLQGASALAMPYGGAGGKPADLAQTAEPDASTAHWHDGKGLHGGHDSHVMSADTAVAGMAHDDHSDASPSCERCGLCQFVHGGVMLNSSVSLPTVPALNAFSAPSDERFSVFIPEQLQRPPLSAA